MAKRTRGLLSMNEKRLYFYRLISALLPDMGAYGIKNRLLKWAGAEIGDGVRICSSARISGGGRLTIGDGTWIGTEALIRASPNSTVSIGKNVDVAPRVLIWTGTHLVLMNEVKAAGPGMSKDIVIKDGAWIATGVIVCPGVCVGECAVVAAGSVVVKDVPARTLSAGCPAAVKKAPPPN